MTTDGTRRNDNAFQPHMIDWDEEKIQRLWDFYGSSPATDASYFGAKVGKHVARTINRNGLFNNASNIIDFSCGKGHLIKHCSSYLKKSASIFGYDPSQKSIEEAITRNKHSANFGGAFQLTSFPGEIESNFADLVLLTEVIEHLNDDNLDAILNECYRILRPGGIFFITTPNNENLHREFTMCPECGCSFHRWQHVRSWSPSLLQETLQERNFKKVNAKTITWGNELINFAFSITGRQKTGIYVIAVK